MRLLFHFALIISCICILPETKVTASELKLIGVNKIWDRADHNAFTDLEFYRGRWYCAFREGKTHVRAGDYGSVRVIESSDGKEWKSVALLSLPEMDLRDAKLSVTPDGQLLLNSWVYNVDADGELKRDTSYSVTFHSKNGRDWSGPKKVGDPGVWIWQTSWAADTGLAVGYRGGAEDKTILYKTKDGKDYMPSLVHIRPPGDKSNEHALSFDENGNAYMLLRRDNPEAGSASHGLLGTSSYPYNDWEWKRLSIRIGGPAMTLLPNGKLLACVRRYLPGGSKTELGYINPETGNYTPALMLPSGGDTSYAGMVIDGSRLLMSYYSSHQGKTSIYLAEIQISSLQPTFIKDRRELFLDTELVSSTVGLTHKLSVPERAGKSLIFDKPWEGVFAGYPTVIKDDNIYHLYYRGLPVARHTEDVEVTCHATSVDGIHWHKPQYNLFKHQAYSENNIVLARHPACHNFSPFIDTRPGVESTERFKAFGGNDKDGLFLMVSPDGVHWKQKGQGPVFRDDFADGWAFDSQNVGFWSESEQAYIMYYRRFINGLRKIYRVQSPDLKTWSKPVDSLANLSGEHLYTNQTQPYFRAPHIYVAFPKRFFPGKVAIDKQIAEALVADPNYRKDTADSILLSSRSRSKYDRTFNRGFVRPGTGLRDWISRSNALGLGVVPSSNDPFKMYIYRLSHYGQPSAHLTRYVLRTDGFASISAGSTPGVLTTTPIVFDGDSLELNFETSAGGNLFVEILEPFGDVIPGFSKDECIELIGDYVDRKATWKGSDNRSLSQLSGKPIQLRFYLQDSDLFSYKFSRSE